MGANATRAKVKSIYAKYYLSKGYSLEESIRMAYGEPDTSKAEKVTTVICLIIFIAVIVTTIIVIS